jgi:prepilin-type N-terminal cleavage/methylation domain-containing protein
MNFRHSFTLIELLVVIAIVGILAGIIIVSMTNATGQATIAKAKVFANSMRDSMANNIISEWKFDGRGIADGSTATTDYIKDTWMENNCSISGSPKVYSGSTCITGSCLSFNGTTDYLDCGGATSLDSADAITIGVWVKLADDYASKTEHIVTKSDSYLIYTSASWNNRPYFYLYCESTENGLAGTFPLQKDRWYYITASYDKSSKKMILYIDGKYNTNRILSGYTDYSITTTSNNVILSRGSLFAGLLDEIRIYNKALSFSQIKQQYYADLQRLYANKGITQEEYNQRLVNLNNYCLANK